MLEVTDASESSSSEVEVRLRLLALVSGSRQIAYEPILTSSVFSPWA